VFSRICKHFMTSDGGIMAHKKLTVALLAGGKSAEREVSLNSGEQVFQELDQGRYEVLRYDPRDDLPRLAQEAARIDVALIILHGRLGEDGTIQGFLELLGIPYQGSGVLSSAIAMNKVLSKHLYQQAGLPVAPSVVLDRTAAQAAARVLDELGLPVVVKPEHEGSSIGLSIVRRTDQLSKALEDAWRFAWWKSMSGESRSREGFWETTSSRHCPSSRSFPGTDTPFSITRQSTPPGPRARSARQGSARR